MATYRFGSFLVRDDGSLWLDGTLVPLSPLQLRLLCLLCRHPQEILDKERIAQAVWGHAEVSDVSLARAVHGLRSRLAAAGGPNDLIRNIYGRGYILTVPVIDSDDSRAVALPGPSSLDDAEPRSAEGPKGAPLEREAHRMRPAGAVDEIGRAHV